MNVDFELRLRDMMSGVLPKVAATARNVFGSVDKSIANSQNQFNAAGRSINDLNTRLSLLTQKRDMSIGFDSISKANREVQELQRHINKLENAGVSRNVGGGGGGGGIASGVFFGNLAAQGVIRAGQEVISQGRSVIDAGMEGSQQRSQFEVLGGEKNGGQLFDRLTKYIQDSVFGNSLYGDASTLMGFGDDTKNVMSDIKMLGDVSRGNAQRMSSLALVYGQSMGAGKMKGDDLNQYISVGFNPLQEISRTTGKSYASLRQAAQDGEITFDMIRGAFKSATSEGGRFYGMLDKIGKTPFGKWEAMKGNVESAKLQLGTALLPAINGIMDAFKPVIDGLPEMMERITPAANKLFGTFTDLLPDIKKAGNAFMADLKPLGGLLISDELKQMGKSALELGTTLLRDLKPAIELVAEAARIAAGISGVVMKSISNDLDFKGALEGSENFFKQVPEWQKKLSNQGGYSELGKLHDYMMKQYGGVVKPWMNDPVQLENYKKTGKLDPHLKGTYSSFDIAGKMGAIKPIWNPMLLGKDRAATHAEHKVNTPAATEASDAIVGGGKRVININYNAPLYKVEHQVFQNVKDAINDLSQLKTEMLKILASVPGLA